jgi:hypothetical protein
MKAKSSNNSKPCLDVRGDLVALQSVKKGRKRWTKIKRERKKKGLPTYRFI